MYEISETRGTAMKVLILGATGLVGKSALMQAVTHPAIAQVIAPTRKPLPPSSKLSNPVAERLELLLPEVLTWGVGAVICALGTTSGKAGSKEAFRQVDYVLPLAFAKLAHQQGAETFALVSASRSRWIWRRSTWWTSKQFGSSMPARTKVSRCCTARLISRSGCLGSGKKRRLERIGGDDMVERGKNDDRRENGLQAGWKDRTRHWWNKRDWSCYRETLRSGRSIRLHHRSAR